MMQFSGRREVHGSVRVVLVFCHDEFPLYQHLREVLQGRRTGRPPSEGQQAAWLQGSRAAGPQGSRASDEQRPIVVCKTTIVCTNQFNYEVLC
jgi:hypothetical protein